MKYKQSISLLNLNADRPPNASDDNTSGFEDGSVWIWDAKLYRCKSAVTGNAVWILLSEMFAQKQVDVIATSTQDLSVRTIQGVTTPNNALFTGEANPADNGYYRWQTIIWAKFPFPDFGYLTEGDFLKNQIFTTQNGTEVGKGYLRNNSGAAFTFVAIGGGGSGITDLSGIPTSTATANTLAFFDADKELISATDILLGTLGIAITKEFDLAFDGIEDTFIINHNLNNEKAIHYTVKVSGALKQNPDDTLYSATSTATTITIQFAVAPATGTGYLTVTGIQKEAVIPPEDEGFPYTLPLTF